MTLFEIMPWLAAIACIAFVVKVASSSGTLRVGSWMLPGALSALFLAWSVGAAIADGPVGFWREHTRNMWGNQIWFDLLLAIAIGWTLIVPPAKALGMHVGPWLLLIICTGCIGFLAMVSRFLYLTERAGQRVSA